MKEVINKLRDKEQEMSYMLNLREVTYALSEALDLVGIDDTRHGKRVAFMAAACAKEGGFDQQFVDEMIYMGMLHDCGVSTTDVHHNLVTQLEWKDERYHCERGAALLEKVALLKRYSPVIYHHHTHWQELKTLSVDEKTKLQANLIYLVDRVDALRVQIDGADLDKKEQIEQIIEENAGRLFSEELIAYFKAAAIRNSFWFYLDDESLEEYLLEWVAKGKSEVLAFDAIREVAVMFADIVDAKSPFTVEHSFGVANLAVYLAERMALSRHEIETVEMAALLHDLGKLRVHDAILNKNDKLDHTEEMSMHRHGFDSNMILRKIEGFKEIAYLASLHHETLDGKGYPYRLEAEAISMPARIIAVADIFQALVQKRPYREALDASTAYGILKEMADEGKLDQTVIGLIDDDLDLAYKKAKCPVA